MCLHSILCASFVFWLAGGMHFRAVNGSGCFLPLWIAMWLHSILCASFVFWLAGGMRFHAVNGSGRFLPLWIAMCLHSILYAFLFWFLRTHDPPRWTCSYMLTVWLGLRAIPNPISGMVSSVDCLENITDQSAKVCDFCYSLTWQSIWFQNNQHHPSEKHGCPKQKCMLASNTNQRKCRQPQFQLHLHTKSCGRWKLFIFTKWRCMHDSNYFKFLCTANSLNVSTLLYHCTLLCLWCMCPPCVDC